MLQIKDEHNDELFRRAAENYPLMTDSANWEDLQKKIAAAPVEDDQPDVEPKKKKRRFLWLFLLLIPLTLFEMKYHFIGKNISNNTSSKSTGNDAMSNTTSAVSEKKEINQQYTNKEKENSNTGPIKGEQNEANIPVIPETLKAPARFNSKQSGNITVNKNEDDAFVNKKNEKHLGPRSNIKIIQGAAVEDDEAVSKKKTVKKDSKKQKISMKAAAPSEDDEVNKPATAISDKDEKPVPPSEAVKTTSPAVDSTAIAVKKDVQNEQKKPDDEKAKETTEKKTVKTDDKVEQTKKDKTKKREKHFYIGLLAGPDLSTIKMQSIEKVGLNYGFVAGYKINKRFAVETGIFKSKKFYSTDGKYFDTKNMNLPPYSTLGYVDGLCNMLEVPVNVTYTIRPRSKSSWFSTVGFSSFIMQNESYKYDVYRYGYAYPYDAKYDNKSFNFCAVINVSAGFTYKLGSIANLRIEPFVKLPVNKIGTGKLPIQSAGILAGFTKTIF